MCRIHGVGFVVVLSTASVWGSTATFAPVGPSSVPAGTDIKMTVTVSVESLPTFNTADIWIGSHDASDLQFLYSAQWMNAFSFLKPITYDLPGFYLQDVLVGGFNPTPVGPSMVVGILTIKTNGMFPGIHVVQVNSNFDTHFSNLGLDGVPDYMFGTGTYTILSPCPGDQEACCYSDGICASITPACCVTQGGTPQGPGSTCLGDSDADGYADLCGDPCQGFPNVDSDGDGLCDSSDPCFGLSNIDVDSDAICDKNDNCPNNSNPNQADLEGDTVGDPCDNCPATSNIEQVDSDGDSLGDLCDPCPLDNPDDSDGDGVCDSNDQCPGADDADDSDIDAVPNECDPCSGFPNVDQDSDGVCDSKDPCTGFPNVDGDSDGLCNSVDSCFGFPNDDPDGDGFCGSFDFCQGFPNVDSDGDGVCDSIDACGGFPNVDLDGDGLCDSVDSCQGLSNVDTDGDGVCDENDACPLDATDDSDNDGVCDHLDQCPGGDDTVDFDANGTPDCLEPRIPTTSQWGLVIMTLLILTAWKTRSRSRLNAM